MLQEIRRRAAAGQSLKSGDNRGDWLYAAAVYNFGSWGKAVKAAGFKYRDMKTRPLTKTEVRRQLRELVKVGEPVLAKDHPELRCAAVRHFGSWRDALAAVGQKNPAATRWTKTNILAAIRKVMAELRILMPGLAAVADRMGHDLEAGVRLSSLRAKCTETRENKGLGIKEAAQQLKVPQYRIKDIEAAGRIEDGDVLRRHVELLGRAVGEEVGGGERGAGGEDRAGAEGKDW